MQLSNKRIVLLMFVFYPFILLRPLSQLGLWWGCFRKGGPSINPIILYNVKFLNKIRSTYEYDY